MLRRMRKWQVTDVMAECGHPKHLTPISQLLFIRKLRNKLTDSVGQVLIVCDDIENPTCQFHYTK